MVIANITMMTSDFDKWPRDKKILHMAIWDIPYKDIASLFNLSERHVSVICVRQGFKKPHKDRKKVDKSI